MQRWHLTAGLAGLVVLTAALVPRLQGQQPTPSPEPIGAPIPEPPAPPIPPAASSGHLDVQAGLDRTAVMPGSNERFLTVTVTAPDKIGKQSRRPVNVAVVMDVSGSMSARGKIDYAKRAAKLLATQMEPSDVYSLVTFSDDATTMIPARHVTDPRAIELAIDRIQEGGSTNLYSGLHVGGEQVRQALDNENVGRVIILSDGMANVGIQSPSEISSLAAELSARGVTVSTVGLGLDYNEDLLARMADLGGGSYDFVDDPRELEVAFRDELERTASIVARNTQVDIQFAPGVSGVEVIGWDAKSTAEGWRIDMGTVHAGETRKIVAKVRVNAPQSSDMDVVRVSAGWDDLVDDGRGQDATAVRASITSDIAAIDASIDQEKAVQAVEAWGSWYLDRSSRAYQAGDVDEAKKLAAEGQGLLVENARKLKAPALQKSADNLATQGMNYDAYAPTSEEGLRIIKGNKEDALEQSR